MAGAGGCLIQPCLERVLGKCSLPTHSCPRQGQLWVSSTIISRELLWQPQFPAPWFVCSLLPSEAPGRHSQRLVDETTCTVVHVLSTVQALSTPLTGGSWDPAGLPESGRWLEGKMTASRSGMAENWTWGDEAGGRKGKARSLWMEPPESQNPSHLRLDYGVFPGGQVVKNPPSNEGDAGVIPGQGTRSHMLQLGAWMPQLKIMHTTTKSWCSQIYIYTYIYIYVYIYIFFF